MNKGMVSKPHLAHKKKRGKGVNHWLSINSKARYFKLKNRGE